MQRYMGLLAINLQNEAFCSYAKEARRKNLRLTEMDLGLKLEHHKEPPISLTISKI